jgi:lysophospholipase L1-like esterase
MTGRGAPPGPAARRVLAAATLAGALATGCGVAQPPAAMSGLSKQISAGERVSAATQAHAPKAAGLAATPAAAGGHRKVPGRQVTAIGDSVMAAGAPALASVLPGIYIDAKPSRQMAAGLSLVRTLARGGNLRPVVVVGLGTNYIVTGGQLSELLRLIGPDRRLVLINTYENDSWSKEVNAAMAAFTRRHPDVVLADWYDTIRNRTYLLWPDQVHPQLPGTRVYARMVYRAVQATGDRGASGGGRPMTPAARRSRSAPGRLAHS